MSKVPRKAGTWPPAASTRGSPARSRPSHDTLPRRLEHKSFSYRPLEIKTRLAA